MSFLREIISSAEKIESEALGTRIPKLKNDTHSCKAEVVTFFDNIYLKFVEKPVKNPELMNELESLSKELEILSTSMEYVAKKEKISEDNHVRDHVIPVILVDYLQETGIILNQMKLLFDIHEKILDMNYFHSIKKYKESLTILEELENSLEREKSETVIKYFGMHVLYKKSTMFNEFKEIIRSSYVTGLTDKKNVSYFRVETNSVIEKILQALYHYNTHIKALDYIIDFLWEFVFIPIITSSTKLLTNENELKICITKLHQTQNYSEVFKKLYRITYFFTRSFQIFLSENENIRLFDYLSGHLKGRVVPLLITHCLHGIQSFDKYEFNYKELIHDSEELENELRFVKLIDDSSLISEYAKKLCQTHSEVRCYEDLNEAKKLLHQKNSETTQVEVPFSNEGMDNVKYPWNTISSKIQGFLDYIEKKLMEMENGENIHCSKLLQSILNVINYIDKKFHHYDSTEIALYFNDCLYIAHNLREWSIIYANVSSKTISFPPFKFEAFQVKVTGRECLNAHVHKQRNLMNDILHVGFKSDSKTLWEMSDSSEHSVLNCLKELQQLKNAWNNILPPLVYYKSIGVILNEICDFLNKFVLKHDLIKNEAAEKLSKIFNIVIINGNTLFTEDPLKKFIYHWKKFEAISFALRSDLVEISNKWCFENGSSKIGLNAFEMRLLIIALFEESQTRADILAKVRSQHI